MRKTRYKIVKEVTKKQTFDPDTNKFDTKEDIRYYPYKKLWFGWLGQSKTSWRCVWLKSDCQSFANLNDVRTNIANWHNIKSPAKSYTVEEYLEF